MNITTNIFDRSPSIAEGQVFTRDQNTNYMLLAQVGANDYRLIDLSSGNRQDDTKWTRHEHTVASIEAHYGCRYIGIPLKCYLEF